MYCNICGNSKENISIFNLKICKSCLGEIENLNIEDANYDYYKNLMRIFLGYYVNTPLILNSVN
ncbi:MAG: sigma factor G inhibitor Gin [Tissierella sp.]|uniref:sigma factor G inhibitor Gin n=1 Tax=Tissierella sp. TaxID=41274 RepID=UPI003F9B480B